MQYNAFFLVPQMLAGKSFRNITEFSLAKEKAFDSTNFSNMKYGALYCVKSQ